MATTGGLANNGAILRQPGVINSQNNSVALTPGQNGGMTQPTPPASHSVVTPGSTVGLIGNHTLNSTTDSQGNTTKYSAPKSNPSVLAQQQALNKLGAGLVEDGIAGPKTSAAITKYGTSGSSFNPNDTEKKSIQSSAPLTAAGQAPLVQNAGQITPTEQAFLNGQNPYSQSSQQAIGGLLNSQKLNQPYADRANEIADAAGKQISDIGRAGARGEAGYLTTGTSPVGEGNAAVLAQTTAAQQGAVSQGANMQLAGNSQALAAQGQAQSGLSSAGGQALSGQGQLLGAAQNQASRAAGQENTVFGATIPGQISGSSRTYNPLNPTGTTGTDGIIQGANNQFTYDTAGKYQAGLQNLQAADAIQNQIIGTLQGNPTLNSTPISAITNLKELLSGQTSQPGQQLLSQQIKQYIDTLGLDPATVTNIASQQRGTLGQLLDSLRQTAENKNEALNPAKVNNSTSSGSSTGANPWK